MLHQGFHTQGVNLTQNESPALIVYALNVNMVAMTIVCNPLTRNCQRWKWHHMVDFCGHTSFALKDIIEEIYFQG